MSAAVKAVIGVVLIAVGEITSEYGGQFLVKAGAALLLSAAAQALGPQAPRAAPLGPVSVTYSGTLEPPSNTLTLDEVGAIYLGGT